MMSYFTKEKAASRSDVKINSSSMADIAFLLLIFFLVTTTIDSEKGIPMLLPSKLDQPPVKQHDRNVLNILLNGKNQLMVEDELMDNNNLKQKVMEFINGTPGENAADSPEDAIVSIKTTRQTSYEAYISTLNKVKAAYYDLRAAHLGLSVEAYLKLNAKIPEEKALLDKAQAQIPMRISDAEPVEIDR
ncbi:biopolymer transporter ExbD [Rapidithrix thailandica]|uniref:Biopolymer transporter ExbD n=1 Tax=Rapidithrix thailandica TaxID=413964 RepID=A0AAW9SBL1_9BACT